VTFIFAASALLSVCFSSMLYCVPCCIL
jgi:hypothetical protein